MVGKGNLCSGYIECRLKSRSITSKDPPTVVLGYRGGLISWYWQIVSDFQEMLEMLVLLTKPISFTKCPKLKKKKGKINSKQFFCPKCFPKLFGGVQWPQFAFFYGQKCPKNWKKATKNIVCLKCSQKSFGGVQWPKFAIFCWGANTCKKMFGSNAPKSHLGVSYD